ncbi:MAG: hypothetical protein WA799_08935 [Nitrosotalea sp.]
MGKSARIKLLGEDYDRPKEGPNFLELQKQRRIQNKRAADMVANRPFWSRLGMTVNNDGSLIETKPA